MTYLDAFADPEIAARLLAQIRAEVTKPWTLMEVCGGQTHSIIKTGIDQLLPPELELVHGARLPRVRHACGQDRPRVGDRGQAWGDLLLLRRHVARAGHLRGPAFGARPGWRRARCLLTLGCRDNRRSQPRCTGRLLRGRIRNDGAGQRHGGRSCRTTRCRQLLRSRQPCAGTTPRSRRFASSVDSRIDGFLAAGTCLRGDGNR